MKIDIKTIVVGVLLVPIAGFLIWNHKQDQIEARNAELRGAMLDYLSQPQFSGRDFLKQLTGIDGRFQDYDLDEEMIYISVPEKEFHDGETLKRLTRYPEKVEFAKIFFDQEQRLGDYTLYNTSEKFFRMPARAFRVDADSLVETEYNEGLTRYKITVAELTEYIHDRATYGGSDDFRYFDGSGKAWYIANHGAFVSRRGESSLERFARPIIKRAGSTENAISAFLYFVTNYIDYNPLETLDNVQVMKHASEVLLTKRATCSGKAILFASLLEQVGVDYLLAYDPGSNVRKGHIAVFVAGNFPNDNGYAVTVFGKRYQYAETTAKDFIIGRSTIKNPDPVGRFRFVQRPGGRVLDRETGQPLEFVER